MNWKNRLTNYNFWISIVSAVLLILQAFEFHFDIMYINEIATAVLGLLVVIGIINDPTKSGKNDKQIEGENSTEKIENATTETGGSLNNLETEKTEIENDILTSVENDIRDIHSLENEIQNFPIDEQNKIVDINSENDYENIVKNISNNIVDEESKIEEIFKKLLNLLKNTEKTNKNADIFENLLKNTENLEKENNNLDVENFSKNEEINNNNNELDIINNDINNQALENLDIQNSIETDEQNIKDEEILPSNNDENSSFNIVN